MCTKHSVWIVSVAMSLYFCIFVPDELVCDSGINMAARSLDFDQLDNAFGLSSGREMAQMINLKDDPLCHCVQVLL